MSEELLKILLSELKIVRIVCKQCKTATEVLISILNREQQQGRSPHNMRCPGCGVTIRLGVTPDHAPLTDAFDHLAKAWKELDLLRGNFDIQFVIPESGTDERVE